MERYEIKDEQLVYNRRDQIVGLESAGDYTKTYCCNMKEFLIEDTLNHLEKLLPKDKFVRISNSFIINADYIKKIKGDVNKYVLLHDGMELSIAQNKYSDLLSFLKIKYKI